MPKTRKEDEGDQELKESESETVAVTETETESFKKYQVKISVPALNVRKGPGKGHEVIATILNKDKEYTIIKEFEGSGDIKKWGKLESGGWISLDHVNLI